MTWPHINKSELKKLEEKMDNNQMNLKQVMTFNVNQENGCLTIEEVIAEITISFTLDESDEILEYIARKLSEKMTYEQKRKLIRQYFRLHGPWQS